jgi:cytochrome b
MKSKMAYDWPIRFFHWTFVLFFLISFSIVKIFDSDGAIFPIHMLIGLTLTFAILLRIVWGFVGSTYAKFSSFPIHPRELINYLKSALTKKSIRSLSHNPASSWVALSMMVIILGLATTGILMAKDINKPFFEDIHELLVDGFVVLVFAHIGGLAWHTFKHKEWIGLSMFNGKKISDDSSIEISQTYLGVGLAYLFVIFAFGLYLFNGYSFEQKELHAFGIQLVLGKVE